MSKIGSHDPFEYFKHKLWWKERPGTKVPIWFPGTKSQESLWLTCVHVMCHVLMKSSQQGLHICFRPHFNYKCSQEVMALQSHGNPNFKKFGIPNLGVWGQNDIWMQAPCQSTKNIIRGKVVASLKSRPWWILWVYVCPWLVRAPKMLQLHTKQLIVWIV